jgi:hypothetical protein
MLKAEHGIEIKHFSETCRRRKLKLLGRIIQAPKYNPLKQVLYELGTMVPRIEHVRRKGKAKLNWLTQIYWGAWKLSCDEDSPFRFEPKNRTRLNQRHQRANNRQGPFAQESNKKGNTNKNQNRTTRLNALEQIQ